jgi:hypothetical protein
MGQFKHISTILDQIAEDSNVHPSIREAMRDLVVNNTIKSQPIVEVYVLLCDGDVTDVFTDKAMAEYDLHTCISADLEEGLLHSWSLVTRQLTTTTLR